MNQVDKAFSDVQEAVQELSVESSPASSQSSSELRETYGGIEEEYIIEDSSSASSSTINPILAQIRQWSPSDVAAFLIDRGFPNQAPNFVQHEISGAILLELDLSMLKEVDIPAFGIRFGIMREIEGLRKLSGHPAGKKSKSRHQLRNNWLQPPPRSPSRNAMSAGEDELGPPKRMSQNSLSTPPFSSSPKPFQRRSSYDPGTPRSQSSQRPFSISIDPGLDFQWESSKISPRPSPRRESGFPDNLQQGYQSSGRNRSASTGMDTRYYSERGWTSPKDSGFENHRINVADTHTHGPGTSGHKRQSSSLTTIRHPPPLMEVGASQVKMTGSTPDFPFPQTLLHSTLVLPGTRSETPMRKAGTKFRFRPVSTRSSTSEKGHSKWRCGEWRSFSQIIFTNKKT